MLCRSHPIPICPQLSAAFHSPPTSVASVDVINQNLAVTCPRWGRIAATQLWGISDDATGRGTGQFRRSIVQRRGQHRELPCVQDHLNSGEKRGGRLGCGARTSDKWSCSGLWMESGGGGRASGVTHHDVLGRSPSPFEFRGKDETKGGRLNRQTTRVDRSTVNIR